jgi:hypothetical protein
MQDPVTILGFGFNKSSAHFFIALLFIAKVINSHHPNKFNRQKLTSDRQIQPFSA